MYQITGQGDEQKCMDTWTIYVSIASFPATAIYSRLPMPNQNSSQAHAAQLYNFDSTVPINQLPTNFTVQSLHNHYCTIDTVKLQTEHV